MNIFHPELNYIEQKKNSIESADKSADKIMQLIAQNNRITIKSLCKTLQLSDRGVRSNIDKLKQQKKLKRMGGKKWLLENN
ncbi:MAG: DeoR family transcriptional regulator [Bacteroidales bacterium]